MKDGFWVEEFSGKPLLPLKRKRKVGKRELEFIGWGSRPLFEFLEVIGKDTGKKHSQREVSEFVTKYVHDRNLLTRPVKKNKRVACDETLQALFGRPNVSRTKIYDLLEEHFAENLDDSEDDLLYSSEDNYEEKNSKITCTSYKKKVFEPRKSCFAAVIPDNIKLVYLKRTLVLELLKDPESFECKIVGSFVRMKSDPNDIYQKNRFQLQLVTGVRKYSAASNAGFETCLRVSNYFEDVRLCMLSDDNFSEEEMADLRDRIKGGLLKKMTVVQLNLKAEMLHKDITKHWIAKEISLLQKLIDHYNEKGRRRELFELLERRKLLQKPSEQEKLLATFPRVIAEEFEPEKTLAVTSEEAEGNICSPMSTLRGLDVSNADASGFGDHATQSQVIFSESNDAIGKDRIDANCVVPFEALRRNEKDQNGVESNCEVSGEMKEITEQPSLDVIGNCITKEMPVVDSSENKSQQNSLKTAAPSEVIELSDDESEPDDKMGTDGIGSESSDNAIWHYFDPQRQIQGPFSLNTLKRWSDLNYFHSEFMVWKTGESENEGVLLVDVLRRTFPY